MAKVGLLVPQGWKLDLVDIADPVEQYEAMTRVGQEAERLGFDSIWLYDHFHTVPTPEIATTFECWISTAGLARDTTTIRIGQMVGCNSYRNPALLAKMASTIDVMSHGRLDFGLGAGWYEHEYRAYGYPYPPAPERLRMLREGLQVIHAMWSDAQATFEGQYYQVRGAINEPKGVQQPHPPIWIGGSGERVTLKLVAQYGDACNIGGLDPAVYERKFAILKEHCATVGRDYNTIIKSAILDDVYLLDEGEMAQAEAITRPYRHGRTLEETRAGGNFVGTPAELNALGEQLHAAGVEYFLIYLVAAKEQERLALLAEQVLPALRAL